MNGMEESGEELILNVGADIRCTDGKCAKLEKLAVNSGTEKVDGLIVRRGLLKKDRRILPLDLVTETESDEISISIHSDELDGYPGYEVAVYDEPAEGWSAGGSAGSGGTGVGGVGGTARTSPPTVRKKIHRGLDDGQQPVRSGFPVVNVTDKVGAVDHVLVDEETGQITHLVVRSKGLLPKRYIVPADYIQHVGEKRVSVDLGEKELTSFPLYEAD